jgi:hypothetical protein
MKYILIFFSFLIFVLLNSDPGSALEFEKYDDLYVNVWAIVDNAPAYTDYNPRDNVKNRIKIRKRYRVVAGRYYIKHDGKVWSQLAVGDGDSVDEIIGWVSHNNLIDSNIPLRNNDTSIYEKVLIREGDMNTKKESGAALRIYKDPVLKISEKDGIKVRAVFYVYDYYPRSATEPGSLNTKSLLISPLSLLDPYADMEPLLTGWIDRSKVTFWNTRTACEFPVGNTVTLINDDDVSVDYKDDKPLPYNSLRNPILQDYGKYYRIGSFARLDADQLNKRRKIEKITTNMEVLFVIDGTRSMTKAFKDTLTGVEKVADYLEYKSKESGLEQPLFGVAFYRDEQTQEPVRRVNNKTVKAEDPDCTEEISPYKIGSIRRFKRTIREAVACDCDRTSPESVYFGLVNSLDRVGFSKGSKGHASKVRLIIHIGDAGDNGRGGFNSTIVANELKKHKIHSYIAIDTSDRGASSDFGKSVKPVVRKFGEKAGFISNPEDLSGSVSEKLMEFLSEAEKTKRQIDIISRGFAGTTEGSAGVFSKEILDRANEIIKANGIDLTGYNVFQHYIEGKILKTTELLKYVLISKTDIENVTSALSQFIDTANIQKRKETWEGILKLIIGEDACESADGTELSMKECNKMRSGIPIKAGFMKYTKNQFLNFGYREVREVVCDAKLARERFRFLVADKRPKLVSFRKDACRFEFEPVQDINGDGIVVKDENSNLLIDKYFFKEGGESVAWIPLEHLGEIEEE